MEKEISTDNLIEKINTYCDIVTEFSKLLETENEALRVYDVDDTEALVGYLIENGHVVSEIRQNKIGLEEYYIELMSRKEAE